MVARSPWVKVVAGMMGGLTEAVMLQVRGSHLRGGPRDTGGCI